jgi:ribose 5-phosphate isomerase
MGAIFSFSLHVSKVILLLLRQRHASRTDLRTTVKYLNKTTSGAVGIGVGTTIKYRDAQLAPPRKMVWAPSSNNCAAPRATAGRNVEVLSTHNERRRG